MNFLQVAVLVCTCALPIVLSQPPPPAGLSSPLKGLKPLTPPKNNSVSTQIVGGTAAVCGQYPWQAALYIDNAIFCGGSLISPRWVLTAAHCLYQRTLVEVLLGAINLGLWGENGRVAAWSTNKIVHASYNPSTLVNDVGLVKLPVCLSCLPTPCISVISLPSGTDLTNTFAGSPAVASGWGRTADSATTISSVLKYVNLTVTTNAICSSVFGTTTVVASTICTTGVVNKGTCSGDSGGPLVTFRTTKFILIGVTSFVASSSTGTLCQGGYPDGFSRVTSYVSWILTNTGNLNQTCCG